MAALVVLPRARVPVAVWDAFVLAHPCGWWWHTSGWLDYGLALGGDREDLSFAMGHEERGAIRNFDQESGTFEFVRPVFRVLGLCPLIREGARCTVEGEPGAWPLMTSELASREMAWEFKRRALPVSFRSCPLADAPNEPEKLAIGWYSRVLDLTQDETVLHADLRNSYKQLVNNPVAAPFLMVDDHGDLAGPYEAVHRAAGGRRPAETYALQAAWIKAKTAFLVGAHDHRTGWMAFAYVFLYKAGAYYGSGPSLVPNVQHAVVWQAILEAKVRGCTRFELGWQGHARTEKERGIEMFKRGWGGSDVPIWVREILP